MTPRPTVQKDWTLAFFDDLIARLDGLKADLERMDLRSDNQRGKFSERLCTLAYWVDRARCEKCGKTSWKSAFQMKGWFFHCGSFRPKVLCPKCVKTMPEAFMKRAEGWLYPWASHKRPR